MQIKKSMSSLLYNWFGFLDDPKFKTVKFKITLISKNEVLNLWT